MFQPGNKLGGRKPGSLNKETKLVRELIEQRLGKPLVDSIMDDLEQCTPEFRADMKERLMKYAHAPLRPVDNSGLPANVDINLLQQITLILQMPREQLNELLKKSLIGPDQDKDPSRD